MAVLTATVPPAETTPSTRSRASSTHKGQRPRDAALAGGRRGPMQGGTMDAASRVSVTNIARAMIATSALLLAIGVLMPSAASAVLPGDNGRIAFISDRDGDDLDIFTMNPDGSGVQQL